MSDLFLPGMSAPSALAKTNRLFLALFPDADTAVSISRLARQMCSRHGLKGTPRPELLLHITLHDFDDYTDVPDKVMRAAEMAAVKVASLPPFEVTFDRVKSFTGKPSNRPCVLVDDGGNPTLRELKQRLLSVLGPGKGERGDFAPHVTLLYDNKIVTEELVEPVTWTVREVVLVRSLIGKGVYEHYRSWPLQG